MQNGDISDCCQRRREILKTGCSIVGSGIVAGCLGTTDGSSSGDTAPTSPPDKQSMTEDEDPTPYEVTVKPAGTHTFDSVPETYASFPGAWMDIAMALGIKPSAMMSLEEERLKYYRALPGVAVDLDSVETLLDSNDSEFDKEVFYEVDADVHLMDPRILKRYSGWNDDDLEEIEHNVGPILGSMIRFPYERDPYYTLYEAAEKAAEIFQRQERYDAWVDLKDEVFAEIQSRLPDDKPTVGAFIIDFDIEGKSLRAAEIDAFRNDTRTFRKLGVNSAFKGDTYVRYKEIGYEKLLDVDPEYIALIDNLTTENNESFQQTLQAAKNHETLSELTAVQNENFVRSAGTNMGPIIDLFSAEAVAMQLYPDEFGEWPGSVGDVPTEQQLFDRQRVADIINGRV
ncbi:ABC transporter substrate-binding protein [Haloarcula rubripromontorii]|uniref:ABC transporter substrate-binding protein n=1 Tax=Haloarcula rubripromontorii TaxID=1705562 RepID=A0A0N0BNK9_9EURY|nr:ferrichrome-binding protein [Haloarcula rubripromontorii]NLV08001.1 ABC transporter substrate-binding protein [Haloarcula rubripromontorii]